MLMDCGGSGTRGEICVKGVEEEKAGSMRKFLDIHQGQYLF